MVTIRTCYSLPEAQVIQSHLQGLGIDAFLPDELTVQNYWLWTNAIGGVRVQVSEEDAERSEDILKEAATDARESSATCPNCGESMKASPGFDLYPKMLLALFFSIPLRSKPRLRCPKCLSDKT
jgi:hypothetical protein